MRLKTRRRLAVEGLEMRCCPSVSAAVVNGVLGVTDGQPNLQVTEINANTFRVQDGGAFDQTFSGVTSDVNVNATVGNQAVAFNFQGNTTPRDINTLFHPGTNTFSAVNGTVSGDLRVVSGAGNDSFFFGDGVSPLAVNHSALVIAGNGSGGNVAFAGNTTVHGNLSIYFSANTTLNAASRVDQNVLVEGASSGGMVAFNGSIGRNVAYIGFNGADVVTTSATATIGGELGIVTNGGNDAISLSGHLHALFVDAGAGDDVLNLSAMVDTHAILLLGLGNDTATLSSTIGTPGTAQGFLYLDAGAGDDFVNMTSTAEVNGFGLVLLNVGNDTFVLQPRFDLLTAFVIGGPGTNTFQGNRSQLRFPPIQFQIFTM